MTSYIIKNIQPLVNEYNENPWICKRGYVSDYNDFMQERDNLLRANHSALFELLQDLVFCRELRIMLKNFGLDARGSRLVSAQDVCNTVHDAGKNFELLNNVGIMLHTLNLHQTAGMQTTYKIIRQIYCAFAERGNITESGGFVAASKTMHFIMPELFIIIDGQHTALSLYNICDYMPLPNNGGDWYDVVPKYSGQKPNPSPRGAGRESWDEERYCIALMYYKRIISEWCNIMGSNIESFLNIDIQNPSKASRIIDKALW